MDVFAAVYKDVFTTVLKLTLRFQRTERRRNAYNPNPDNNESTSCCPLTAGP
jgi:hypothetical protein